MNRNFSQTIAVRCDDPAPIIEMLSQWDLDQATSDIMGYMGTRVLADRDEPGHYVIVADFGVIDPDVSAADEAARNNERPETQAFAARLRELVDGEPEYHHYDELYRTDMIGRRSWTTSRTPEPVTRHIAYRVIGEPGRVDVVMVAGALFPLELLAEDRVASRFMSGSRRRSAGSWCSTSGVSACRIPMTDWSRSAQEQWAEDLLAVIDAAGLEPPGRRVVGPERRRSVRGSPLGLICSGRWS